MTLFFSTPTSIAPPTPTKPPAIAPVKVVSRNSLAALTQTSWLPLAPELPPVWLIAALPIQALVLELTTATLIAPETPTKPAPAATVTVSSFSDESACTTSPCGLAGECSRSPSKPLAASPPAIAPVKVPVTPEPPPPLASTVAPLATKAWVSLSIVSTPTDAPTPTKPAPSAPLRLKTLVSSLAITAVSPPEATWPRIEACVEVLNTSTVTPPPTPTTPPPTPMPTSRMSSAAKALTETSSRALTSDPVPSVALVVAFITVTSMPGATPTMPTPRPAASAMWWKSLAAATLTVCAALLPAALPLTCALLPT